MARALAMVVMNRNINAIFRDFMVKSTHAIMSKPLKDFLEEGEELPAEVSFWQVASRVSRRAGVIPIGWSSKKRPHRTWHLNPHDKTRMRPWSPEDRLVVIQRL